LQKIKKRNLFHVQGHEDKGLFVYSSVLTCLLVQQKRCPVGGSTLLKSLEIAGDSERERSNKKGDIKDTGDQNCPIGFLIIFYLSFSFVLLIPEEKIICP